MDRVGELAQLGKQVTQVPLELGERLVGPRVAAAQPLAGQRQLGRQDDQVLLDAVVQVPLDTLALRALGLVATRARDAVSSVACRADDGRGGRSAPRSGAGCAAVAAWPARWASRRRSSSSSGPSRRSPHSIRPSGASA